VVLVVGLATWWLTSGRYTNVPKVTGMTVAAATAELRGPGSPSPPAPRGWTTGSTGAR
jgi:hypothetical protein